MQKTILFLSVFLLFTNTAYSQIIKSSENNSFENKFYTADAYIDDGNFQKAIEIYEKLLETVPDNGNLNFKIGYCYIHTAQEKGKAITYLKKAINNITDEYNENSYKETKAPLEAYFYLGKAYHFNYEFYKAIEIFNKLLTKLSEKEILLTDSINQEIISCKNAIELVKHPINMIVTNLGDKINTEYDEHSPVVSGDQTVLIYTSKRKDNTGNKLTTDGQYFEDIYASYKIGDNWSPAQQISDSINTSGHEASIGLSFDGNQLFIYKDDNGDGNIYSSNKDAIEWSAPKKLEFPINTKAKETHASLSFDGNTLYFTSDRKGGYGGMDIYRVKKLPNGKWSNALNLGPTINTKYNEEGPYIHPDDITLFFSSQGHKTMGGFDIFASTQNEDGKWAEPENIGYPINTTDDDVFYIPTLDGRKAYYASHQIGSIGRDDIFIIDLPESSVRNQTVITGTLINKSGEIIREAQITVNEDHTGTFMGVYSPNNNTGRYIIILPRGKKYNITIEAPGYTTTTTDVTVPKKSYDQTKKIVKLNPVELLKKYYVNKTVLFDFDKHETDKKLTFIYTEILDVLAEYLTNNPNTIIEISGFADATGPADYNYQLSVRRANFVKNYLLNKKIKSENLIIKGFGEDNPIAKNNYEDGSVCIEGRKYNRRVEFKIIKKGKEPLSLKPIGIPDKFLFN
ncbi:MAG: PD40 domain-containing protein [Bacteroidetes bacterium]|nr:PD40 domain-containing protein [Bacteroidota bacterium]